DTAVSLFALVGYFLYDTVLTARQGATIGKRVAGVQVRRVGGDLPGYGLCVARFLARAVSILPMLLGVLWVAFDPAGQTFRDRLCSTVVVRRNRIQPVAEESEVQEPSSASSSRGWTAGEEGPTAAAGWGSAWTQPAAS